MKPNYCPNCGLYFKAQDSKGLNSTVSISDADDSGYDCYCGWCGWSGDIWPDDEARDNTEKEKGGTDGN